MVMRLCVVISSIGRTDRLDSLLESLAEQTDKSFVVGVCDQSEDRRVAQVADKYRTRLNIFTTTSGRGLSRGRNAVVGAAGHDVTHLIFPNDTSSFAPTLIADLRRAHANADVIALSYVHDDRARYEFKAGTYPLTALNVWRIIEPAMVLSRRAYDLAGGFDNSLGTGSGTPWQSGEGTDLLLKLLGEPLDVVWDPSICVSGVSQNFGLTTSERRAKLRVYGRGYGFLLAKWRYPIWRCALALFGPLVAGIKSLSISVVFDALPSMVGRAEGLCDGVKYLHTRQPRNFETRIENVIK